MGGPDEPLGHDRIALVVDLEAPAVHEPRPGALDDPAFREHFEATGMDAVHDFDSDVMVATVLDEGAFEAGVAPQLGEASGTASGTVGDGDPTDVVRDARRHDHDRDQESERVDDPEGLAAVNFLSGVKSLVFLLTVDEARTERASTMPADGSLSRPSFWRTAMASRSAMRSHVPSLDHSRW